MKSKDMLDLCVAVSDAGFLVLGLLVCRYGKSCVAQCTEPSQLRC